MKRATFWGIFWVTLGALYLFIPLWGTFDFSLRAERDVIGFAAYSRAFADPRFWQTFLFSNQMAIVSIIVSILLIVPTAYWVQLKVPQARPAVELITLMPFVIPAIILVFGYIRTYSKPLTIGPITILPPLTETDLSTNFLLIMGYVVLALPYMYRSVDNGLRAIDVRTLTEAAQSLGAGWFTIMFRIIMPNLRAALLSGALLTFAIVVGELTLATFLGRPAFGPYLQQLGQHKAYEPAALSIVSFLLTWLAMVLIYLITRGDTGTTATTH